MPKVLASAIASVPSKRKILILCGALIILAVFLVFNQRATAPSKTGEMVDLRINDKHFNVEVVRSAAARTQGLGGRISLNQNSSMLFVFDDEAIRCFWMKDMRFAIDILWLDSEKRVVHQKQHVEPSTYPENFCSDEPARYVLEFNAGVVSDIGLTEDQQLTF